MQSSNSLNPARGPVPPFRGVIGRTIDESVAFVPPRPEPSPNAPNVVFIVLDDTGFGQLGCYGSPIATPNLDALAANGLLYTNMHTTAYCAPTRSCVLTGRNHHSNHMGANVALAMGFPGYDGYVPFENGMLSEILVDHGYATFAVGKWHLVPEPEMSAAGPYDRWPLGRGFQRYYGFLGGKTHQFYPDLVYDNHHVVQPLGPADGYHLTADLVDHSIGFIADTRNVAPGKPFFLYFCPGATHNPHHVARKWSDPYRGAFDGGWDAYRSRVFERQLELGIVPPGTELPPRNDDVARWDDCDPDARRMYARMMEVYAGFLSHTDHEIGRLIAFLEATGDLDNTLCMVISDNGACPGGGPDGYVYENGSFQEIPHEKKQAALEEIGGPRATNHYPWGWAWAGNTPFRRWKRETYRGGVSDPFIVHWPAGFAARGEVRAQFAHAIDMVPTVLKAIGIDAPARLGGVEQSPVEGFSLVATFDGRDRSEVHRQQYFEQLGHRSIYRDGWRAVAPWPGPTYSTGRPHGTPIAPENLAQLDVSGWELYHVAEDFAEARDLAAADLDAITTGIVARWRGEGRDPSEAVRSKLQQLIVLWYTEAGRYGVEPIDGRTAQSERHLRVEPERARHVLYPGSAPIPTSVAPRLGRAYRIDVDVDVPAGGASGVLVSHGGVDGGYALFVQDGHVHYAYNLLGDVTTVTGDGEIPPGRHAIAIAFEPSGGADTDLGHGLPGILRLFVDDVEVGSGRLTATTLRSVGRNSGFAIGYDAGAPVTADYEPPFTFQGTIRRVVVETGQPVTGPA